MELQVQSLVLARLLGCVGYVAQQQLVHLEVTVTKELKGQRQEEQEKKTPRKRAASHKKVLVGCNLHINEPYILGTEYSHRGGADVNWSYC